MIGRKALNKKTALPQSVRDLYVWMNRNVGRLDPAERTLPNFLIVGAQRGGTTSLFIYLLAHSLVFGPRRAKGVHYFDTNFEHSLRWYRSNFPRQSQLRDLEMKTGSRAAVGEGAPYYLYHPAIPARIHRAMPECKIIAILREPLDRAVSHHHHEVTRGFEDLDLVEAIRAEPIRLKGEEQRLVEDAAYISRPHIHHSYIGRGQYANQIERYLDLFGEESVLVLDSARLKSDTERTVARTLDFLGLDPVAGVEYPQYNKREHDPVSPELRENFGPLFDRSNARLKAMLPEGTLSWLE